MGLIPRASLPLLTELTFLSDACRRRGHASEGCGACLASFLRMDGLWTAKPRQHGSAIAPTLDMGLTLSHTTWERILRLSGGHHG